MTSAAKPWPHTVIYDPEAVVELLAMKSKEEHRALLNAVRKLGELGEQLGPPHMKPLKGDRAAALRELRPRQGQKRLACDLPTSRRLLRDPRHRSAQELRRADRTCTGSRRAIRQTIEIR
jgi:hypothetical protein